jgi:hypothetical protein
MADDDRADDGRALPTTNHPLHGPTRPLARPVVAVLGLFVVVALVFALITWLRYNT